MQYCFWVQVDSSTLDVPKMHFFSSLGNSVQIWPVAQSIPFNLSYRNWINLNKDKVVLLKELVLKSGNVFLIWHIFKHAQFPLVHIMSRINFYIKNQLWLIAFKTNCNFLEKFFSSFIYKNDKAVLNFLKVDSYKIK